MCVVFFNSLGAIALSAYTHKSIRLKVNRLKHIPRTISTVCCFLCNSQQKISDHSLRFLGVYCYYILKKSSQFCFILRTLIWSSNCVDFVQILYGGKRLVDLVQTFNVEHKLFKKTTTKTYTICCQILPHTYLLVFLFLLLLAVLMTVAFYVVVVDGETPQCHRYIFYGKGTRWRSIAAACLNYFLSGLVGAKQLRLEYNTN